MVSVPFALARMMSPLFPYPTFAFTEVSDTLMIAVAGTPPNQMSLLLLRPVPEIVTVSPCCAEAGLKDIMDGDGASLFLKTDILLVVLLAAMISGLPSILKSAIATNFGSPAAAS